MYIGNGYVVQLVNSNTLFNVDGALGNLVLSAHRLLNEVYTTH